MNSRFIRSSKAIMKRCSGAPNAREATVRQSVENAPASNNPELMDFARTSKTKRKRCSRVPKARAEKFWSILCGFSQKWPCVPLLWQKVHKTSILRVLQVHVLTSTWFLARASQVNRKRCSRAPKARAEKICGILCELYANVLFRGTVLGKQCSKRSTLRMLQSHSFTNPWGSRARPEQSENDACER